MRYSDATENILTEQHAIATRRTAFEAGLVAVKGLLRDRGIVDGPVCLLVTPGAFQTTKSGLSGLL